MSDPSTPAVPRLPNLPAGIDPDQLTFIIDQHPTADPGPISADEVLDDDERFILSMLVHTSRASYNTLAYCLVRGLHPDHFRNYERAEIYRAITKACEHQVVEVAPLLIVQARQPDSRFGYAELVELLAAPVALGVHELAYHIERLLRSHAAATLRETAQHLYHAAERGHLRRATQILTTLTEVTERHAALLRAGGQQRIGRRYLREDEIDAAIQPPTWLVDGLLAMGEVTMLVAPGNTGKTFWAIDLAMWVGRYYPLLYVGAEDAPGIKIRKRAWELHYRLPRTGNFFLWPNSIALNDDSEVSSIIDEVRELGLVLVVLDTLSQCIPGVEENSNAEMSRVMGNAKRIARETGAGVLILHHTTKDGGNYRGASAIKDNTYGLLTMTREGDVMRLDAERIKNVPQFVARYYKAVEVTTDILDSKNRPMTSAVLLPAAQVISDGTRLNQDQIKILEAIALLQDGPERGARSSILERDPALPKQSAYYRALAELFKFGYIDRDGVKRTAPLIITTAGRAKLKDSRRDGAQSGAEADTGFALEINLALPGREPLDAVPPPLGPSSYTSIEGYDDDGSSYQGLDGYDSELYDPGYPNAEPPYIDEQAFAQARGEEPAPADPLARVPRAHRIALSVYLASEVPAEQARAEQLLQQYQLTREQAEQALASNGEEA